MLPFLLLLGGLAFPGQEAAPTMLPSRAEAVISLPASKAAEEKGALECLDQAETDASGEACCSLPLPASYYPLLSRPRGAPASTESLVSGASAKP